MREPFDGATPAENLHFPIEPLSVETKGGKADGRNVTDCRRFDFCENSLFGFMEHPSVSLRKNITEV